jgi:polysaccharide deacetylase 2 family uncharacterized protein YibQ
MVSNNEDDLIGSAPGSDEDLKKIDFFYYKEVEKKQSIYFYNIPWWVYYFGAWAVIILGTLSIAIYTLLTPPKLSLIIKNRTHQIAPVQGLFYPPDFERNRQAEKNEFFQKIQRYKYAHLSPENTEVTPQGLKPVKSASGAAPWEVYGAEKSTKSGRRLVIIVRNLGISERNTGVVFDFPPQIVLNFSPYTRNLNQWVAYARGNGNEVIITLPLEPQNVATTDSGSLQLSSSNSTPVNLSLYNKILGLTTGYTGLIFSNDSRIITGTNPLLKTIMRDVSRRGLILVDNRLASNTTLALNRDARNLGIPYRAIDWSLTQNFPEKDVRSRLRRLESLIARKRTTVALFSSHPLTLSLLSEWIKKTDSQNIQLVPLTQIL